MIDEGMMLEVKEHPEGMLLKPLPGIKAGRIAGKENMTGKSANWISSAVAMMSSAAHSPFVQEIDPWVIGFYHQ